jgi:hypothetical protein
MKFNILINQKAVIDAGFDLDIVDLAIFELLKDFSLTNQCKKMTEGDTVYFLFNWKLVNNQLPIIGLNSRQAVFKRMEKLKACDIINPHKSNASLGKSWYCFGPNYHKLIFAKASTTVDGGVNESLQGSVNNGLHNNVPNSNNEIKDKEQPEQIIRKKKIDFLKLVIDWVTVHPSKYPKLMYVDFSKYWLECTMKNKTKLRYEEQKFFDIGRRLGTWFQKAADTQLVKYWDNEDKIETLNDLFKKQILNNDPTA